MTLTEHAHFQPLPDEGGFPGMMLLLPLALTRLGAAAIGALKTGREKSVSSLLDATQRIQILFQ